MTVVLATQVDLLTRGFDVGPSTLKITAELCHPSCRAHKLVKHGASKRVKREREEETGSRGIKTESSTRIWQEGKGVNKRLWCHLKCAMLRRLRLHGLRVCESLRLVPDQPARVYFPLRWKDKRTTSLWWIIGHSLAPARSFAMLKKNLSHLGEDMLRFMWSSSISASISICIKGIKGSSAMGI